MNRIGFKQRVQRRLKAAGAEKGYTQERVAKKLMISRSYYSKIESDLSKANFYEVCMICSILGLEMNVLYMMWEEDKR